MTKNKTRILDGYTQTSSQLHEVCGIYARFLKKLCSNDRVIASIHPYHDGETEVVTIAIWSERDEELGLQICLRATGKYGASLPNPNYFDTDLEHVVEVHDMVEGLHFCSMILAALNAQICRLGNVHNESNPQVSVPKEDMPKHPFGRIYLWDDSTEKV